MKSKNEVLENHLLFVYFDDIMGNYMIYTILTSWIYLLKKSILEWS